MPTPAGRNYQQNLKFFAELKKGTAKFKLQYNAAAGLFYGYSGNGFARTLGNTFKSQSDKQSVMNDAMFATPIKEVFSEAIAKNFDRNVINDALDGLIRFSESYSGDASKYTKMSQVIRALEDSLPFRIHALSECNNEWGICGFASSLAALYDKNVLKTRAQGLDLPTRILAEIKTYLVILQSENSPLIQEIEAFTRSFGPPFATFRVVDFLKKINNVTNPNVKELGKGYDVAMPVNAVIDFLKRNGKPGSHLGAVDLKQNGVILGLGSQRGEGRLQHWVSKFDDDWVYNWGKRQKLSALLREKKWGVNFQVIVG